MFLNQYYNLLHNNVLNLYNCANLRKTETAQFGTAQLGLRNPESAQTGTAQRATTLKNIQECACVYIVNVHKPVLKCRIACEYVGSLATPKGRIKTIVS